jgi:hypothetical protein
MSGASHIVLEIVSKAFEDVLLSRVHAQRKAVQNFGAEWDLQNPCMRNFRLLQSVLLDSEFD